VGVKKKIEFIEKWRKINVGRRGKRGNFKRKLDVEESG
jgi:hypothetical protein